MYSCQEYSEILLIKIPTLKFYNFDKTFFRYASAMIVKAFVVIYMDSIMDCLHFAIGN